MGIGRHEQTPVLIVTADIVQNQSLRMMEEQDAAEHVGFALIAHQFRMAAGISHGNPEVMIVMTMISRHTRLRTGKHEDAGLPISADFIVGKRYPTLGSVQDDT